MSVIHEALKKSNRERELSAPFRGSDRRKASAGWRPILIVGVVLLAVSPIFAARFVKQLGPTEPSRALGQFAMEEAPLPAHPVAAAAAPFRPFKKERFELSGVVFSGGESYCLVNGLVLRKGESVGGATIESIETNSVTLDLSGQKITLPVKI